MKNAAMLWTGGKDSSLALYEAGRSGYGVRCLITFAPPEPDFLAHPLAFMKMQAQALALPHYVVPIHEPFEKSYEIALTRLRDETGIRLVITGDIAKVGGQPNWICECCRKTGLGVHIPLWGRDQNILLRQVLDGGFKVFFSCVNTRWLDESWVGRELNNTAVAELQDVRRYTGLDLCGEEGEYHTLVADGPPFTRAIDVRSCSRRVTDLLAHMDLHELKLVEK